MEKDVFEDAYEAMKLGPKRNVQIGNFLELPREEQLQRGISFVFLNICHSGKAWMAVEER